jgi:hypothetical protein
MTSGAGHATAQGFFTGAIVPAMPGVAAITAGAAGGILSILGDLALALLGHLIGLDIPISIDPAAPSGPVLILIITLVVPTTCLRPPHRVLAADPEITRRRPTRVDRHQNCLRTQVLRALS